MDTINKINNQIIKKRLIQGLNHDEEIQFQLWLNDDESHRAFYSRAEKYHKHGSSVQTTVIQEEQAWKQLNKRMSIKIRRRIISSMSIAASLTLIVGLFYLINPKEAPQILAEQNYKGTTLILDNGESISLNQSAKIDLDKAIVKNNTITYKSSKNTTKRPTYNTLYVNKGETFKLTLPDGTVVTMNSDSKIKYPLNFDKEERLVDLIGEAYFEVAHNENQPFKVKTGSQLVEVLGTTFNISAYNDNNAYVTTLIEGKVKVWDEQFPNNSSFLLPNQQAIIARSGTMIIKDVDVSNYTSWRDGFYSFKNEELSDIMKKLSHWYEIDYCFTNDNIKSLKFSGRIKKTENIEDLFYILEKTGEVNFTTNNNTITIN